MAVEFKDYYQVLGVSRTASDDDIKKAFRKLARQYHPDVAKDKKNAEAKFKEINEAYEVLGNPENRKKYDELGAHWKHGAQFRPPPGWQHRTGRGARPGGTEEFEFHFGGTGFSDFFEQFFGGRGGRFGGFADHAQEEAPEGFGRQREFAQRGQDVEGDILVTLDEALHGSVRAVTMERANPRTGAAETQTFKVRIPAGVREGQLIRLAGRGGEGAGGGSAGDLYLRVRLAQHPDFRVRGSDLYYDLDLAPWEAVLGTTVTVPTLDGPVSLRVPGGAVQGQQLRVRNRGLPGTGATRGDYFAVVNIHVPAKVSDAERALWEQLARGSGFNPRKPG
jgi:curved DNA-binding protein